MGQRFEFSINLSEQKTRKIYQGNARYLLVVTDDGLKLQLPVANFRQFISDTGIRGRFRVETDEKYRLLKLEKLQVSR